MITYYGFATQLFGSLVDRYAARFAFLKDQLVQANIKIPFRTYLSTAASTSLLSYFFSLIGFFIFFNFFDAGLMKVLYLTIGPVAVAFTCFIFFLFTPYQKVNSRRRNIEGNLPFALTHMGSVAESGAPPYIVFKLLAQYEEYGEISNEMKKLVRNIDKFGLDPLTAVKELAERTPSSEFRQVLLGVVTTTESGGDVKTYIKNAGQQAIFNWRMKREKFMQQLSAYAEFYTGIVIAAPLFIISLFSVMSMIQPELAGFKIIDLTKISIYALVPLINIAFLLFLRGIEVEM